MKDYRNKFNFRLGTTSYILHDEKDNLVKNVNFLKDHFDEIQLLYFGKDYLDDLIEPGIVNRLYEIKKRSKVSFIAHLPLDLNLLKPDKNEIRNSIGIINHLADKIKILDIKKYILHMDRYNFLKSETIELNAKNHELFEDVLNRLEKELTIDPDSIFIENTNYDLTFFSGIILKKKFNVCLDIGHLYLTCLDLNNFIDVYKDKTGVIHIHGFKDYKDHMALDAIDKEKLTRIFNYLKDYKNTVIIEVFNENDLADSLKILDLNKKFLTSGI